MAKDTNPSADTPAAPKRRVPAKLSPATEAVIASAPTAEQTGTAHAKTENAAKASQTIKDSAGKFAKQAADKARDYLDEGKTRAGGALDEVSRLMEDAAGTVDDKLGEQYGQYARSAAQTISGLSESLKAKELEDILADAQTFVRKSPAVAIGIAAALGFVVARLVKAGLDTPDPTDAASPPKESTMSSDAAASADT